MNKWDDERFHKIFVFISISRFNFIVDNNINLGIFWYKGERVLVVAQGTRFFEGASHHQLVTARCQGQQTGVVRQLLSRQTVLFVRFGLGHQDQGVWHLVAPLALQVTVNPEMSGNLKMEIVPKGHVDGHGLSDWDVPTVGKFFAGNW